MLVVGRSSMCRDCMLVLKQSYQKTAMLVVPAGQAVADHCLDPMELVTVITAALSYSYSSSYHRLYRTEVLKACSIPCCTSILLGEHSSATLGDNTTSRCLSHSRVMQQWMTSYHLASSTRESRNCRECRGWMHTLHVPTDVLTVSISPLLAVC